MADPASFFSVDRVSLAGWWGGGGWASVLTCHTAAVEAPAQAPVDGPQEAGAPGPPAPAAAPTQDQSTTPGPDPPPAEGQPGLLSHAALLIV